MKVKLLGTGAIYSKYNCASELIDEKILVDVGNGVLKELRKINYDLTKLKMIIITHLHADHYADLPALILNLDVEESLEPIYIVGPKELKNNLIQLCHIYYGDFFDKFIKEKLKFIEVLPETVAIDEWKEHNIVVQKVNHYNIESYGYIINHKLGITGDTCLCKEVLKIFENSEVILTDISMIKGTKYHMGIDDIEKIRKTYENKIIATHLRDDTREELQKKSLKNVIIPEDGTEIIV